MVAKSAKKNVLTNKQAQVQYKKKLKLVAKIRGLQVDLANINVELANSGIFSNQHEACW